METDQLLLLKSRRFLPLFITQFLGAFNDNVFKNALVILIMYRLFDVESAHPQLWVTFAAGIFILPFFLFSGIAGQLADKYEKSRLITIIKFFEIILMGCAVIGFYFANVYFLLFTLFALGIQATFFGPLKYAILPEHLQENELIAGNGFIEAGTFLAILLGTLLGGLLILTAHGELWISMTVMMIAVGGWVSSFYIPKTEAFSKGLTLNFHFLQESRRLIDYSKERWDIFLSILGISWFWLVGATFLAEMPVFVKEVLFANGHVVTFFLTLFSIGLGIGSLLCNRLLKGKVEATYVPLGALGISLFTIDLYFNAQQMNPLASNELMTLGQFLSHVLGWRMTLDLLLLSICGGIYTVPLYAILQSRSEKNHRARMIASNNVMNALFMVVGAFLTMILLAIGFSVNHVFLLVAIINLFVAVYICKLLPDKLIYGFFRTLLTFFYRVKVKGLEHYHEAGDRVLIIANHTSFIDALLLAIFLPDKLTFAVNTATAKKGWISFFLRLVNAYPIDPTHPLGIKSLIEFLNQNKRCVIFPEGRLTSTGALMKIYEGPGLVADKSGAQILPIRIEGAEFTPFSRLRGKVPIRLMPSITINIFPPKKLEVSPELTGRKRRQYIGYQLYDLMTQVMFESLDYRKTLFSSLLDARSAYGRYYPILEDIQREPAHYQQVITRCFILGSIIKRTTHLGEYVGILLPNAISTAITFFALQAISRVPAMLNYSAGISQIIAACQAAPVKSIYTSHQFIKVAKLEDLIAALEQAGFNIIYLEDLRSKVTLYDKLKGALFAQFPRLTYKLWHLSRATQPFLNPDSPAVLLFTSGSEGAPKGVVLSHANIQANRYQLTASIDFSVNDKVFNALPIFHSFGLTGGMLLPILAGVKIFFYPSPLHYRIIPELSYDTNATIFFGTDTFLAGYARFAHQYDFYSIRYVFAGAEKLREETRTLWAKKFGVRILEGYGATETSPVIATNTPMQNKAGTVGRLLPGMRCTLKPVPGIAEGGVLVVSGPNVMKGYLLQDQPGVILPPENGWYETGDVVTIDEVGFITIQGRVKRFAKIAGEMISLVMVEQVVKRLWPDEEHAVVAAPDPKKGEQLVLLTTRQDASREELVRYAKDQRLAEIMVPKKIIQVSSLPLLGTGKVDYFAIKDMINNIFLTDSTSF